MLLAIERSGAVASAAIFDTVSKSVMATEFAPTNGRGDAWPLVRGILAKASVSPAALTRLAVGTGPGSFSGIRAALALAQGLALPDDLPLCGVLSAAAAVRAWRANNPGLPQAVLLGDARRGEIWRFDEPTDGDAWKRLSHTAADISLSSSGFADLDDSAKTLLSTDANRLANALRPRTALPVAADAETVGRMALEGLCGPPLPVYLHPAAVERTPQ